MRTKEFIKKVEELGLKTYWNGRYIDILNGPENLPFCTVCRTETMQINNDDEIWNLLPENKKEQLFALLIAYAKTPINERKEPKKYYLKHRWIGNGWWQYLNLLDDGTYYIKDRDLIEGIKNTFTLKEIEEIKEKYNTDLSDFEIVGVEE